MNLRKMVWLLMVVIAGFVAPVTKSHSSSLAPPANFIDGTGPVAPPIPW
jgi:hypothetical protein